MKKNLKYILIPLVLLIWALVFYEFFSYSGSDTQLSNIPQKKPPTKNLVSDTITYELDLDYPDPFLKNSGLITELSDQATTMPMPTPQIVPAKPIVHITNQLPEYKRKTILYGGQVINEKNKQITAILKIDGKNKLMSAGEEINSVKIIKIFPDSIIVSENQENRTILKTL